VIAAPQGAFFTSVWFSCGIALNNQSMKLEVSYDESSTWFLLSGSNQMELPPGVISLRYRITLYSDGLSSPVLSWVNVSYNLECYPFDLLLTLNQTTVWRYLSIMVNSIVINFTHEVREVITTQPTFSDQWGNRLARISLNISSGGVCSLNISSLFINYKYNATIPDVDIAVNKYLEAHPDALSIPVNFSSLSQTQSSEPDLGYLYFKPAWDFPPRQAGFISDLIEDTPITIDLSSLYWDDGGTLNLTYSLLNYSENITLVLDPEGYGNLTISPDNDWYGAAFILIEVSDNLNLPVRLNYTFNITPVDDPPQLNVPPVLQGFAERIFTYNLTEWIYDKDTDVDKISISSNSSNLWFIGHIMFCSFLNEGEYIINLTAFDGSSYTTVENISIHIVKLLPPAIHSVPTINISVNQSYTIDLAQYIYDPDNYTLRFEVFYYNSSLLNVSLNGSNLTIFALPLPSDGQSSKPSAGINTLIQVVSRDETNLTAEMNITISITPVILQNGKNHDDSKSLLVLLLIILLFALVCIALLMLFYFKRTKNKEKGEEEKEKEKEKDKENMMNEASAYEPSYIPGKAIISSSPQTTPPPQSHLPPVPSLSQQQLPSAQKTDSLSAKPTILSASSPSPPLKESSVSVPPTDTQNPTLLPPPPSQDLSTGQPPLSPPELLPPPPPVSNTINICNICEEKIEEHLVKCECGMVYHTECLNKVSFCPECGKKAPKGITEGEREEKKKKKSKSIPLKAKSVKLEVITATAGATTKCAVCLGNVKSGNRYVKCFCGKNYHLACAKRVGSCINCNAVFES
ncbi:MAG: hypothetical protein QW728_02520, partial [Thermoplasmata archaeon]